MITKFKNNIPIDHQLKSGDIYVCPFTGLEKIWTKNGGYIRYYEVIPSVDIKKCGKRLSRVKDREHALKAAGLELASL